MEVKNMTVAIIDNYDYGFGKVLKYMYIIDTILLVIFCIFGTYSVFYTLAHFMK